jgi:hypothetical protein
LVSCEVKKYNDYGFRQDWILVITNKALYNLKKKTIKRRIPFENIQALTKSEIGQEFVIHVSNENDYWYLSFNFKELILQSILRCIVVDLKLKDPFPLFSVP